MVCVCVCARTKRTPNSLSFHRGSRDNYSWRSVAKWVTAVTSRTTRQAAGGEGRSPERRRQREEGDELKWKLSATGPLFEG